jgi:hypothetical protein
MGTPAAAIAAARSFEDGAGGDSPTVRVPPTHDNAANATIGVLR